LGQQIVSEMGAFVVTWPFFTAWYYASVISAIVVCLSAWLCLDVHSPQKSKYFQTSLHWGGKTTSHTRPSLAPRSSHHWHWTVSSARYPRSVAGT